MRGAWAWSLMLAAGAARAGTLDVPGQYPTIQAAIDAAQAGDTVVVQPGSYHEALILPGIDLTLLAPGGADVTTIDATGLDASVVSIAIVGVYSTVIDGFTLTGGAGTPIYAGERAGGGVYVQDSGQAATVTVRHCRITGNSVPGSGAGGGVYGGVRLEGCEISGNHAADGGGVFSLGFPHAALVDCTVSGNLADSSGGGLWGHVDLTDCLISGNTAGQGGGLHGYSFGVLWSRVTFEGNSAGSGGGCAIIESIVASVANATFIGNQAASAGAVLLVSNYDMPFASNAVVNCAFVGNVSADGGATIASYTSFGPSVGIRNSTLVGEALASGASVKESILWQMAAPLPAGMTITNSDVDGGWPGTGNIAADPLFANLAANDIHLLAASPCRNAAGSGSGLVGTTDIDGDPRVLEGQLDMGADEYADDCNGNGVLDWQDLESGTSIDCDDDGIPDDCQPFVDCNGNGLSDACDIAAGRSTDCNHNGQPDECESLADCDGDGIADVCEGADCNGNGVLDACDLAAGTSLDTDGNGVPDECHQIIHVPGDQPTIAAAVQVCNPGDTILLEPGVHAGSGNHDITLMKSLLVAGETGADECIIDCEQAGRAFVIEGDVQVTLRDLTIRNGSAALGAGAVDCQQDAQLLVSRCVLRSNSSPSQPGGALRVRSGASATLEGSTLADNVAGNGGAVSVQAASVVASHCTFSGNAAVGALISSKGGTFRAQTGAMLVLRDAILVGGSADAGDEIHAQDAGTVVDVAFSDVAGGESGVVLVGGATLAWGAGNIDADPLLKDPAGGDWRLSGGSPCIDSGDPAGVPDTDGTPPDMGAWPFEAFEDVGFALAGADGSPLLAGEGTLIAGDPLTLSLSGAAPQASTILVSGVDLLLLPFKGGVMVPTVEVLVGPLATGADGTLELLATWPAGIPSGFVTFVQAWLPDATGPAGFAASNGLALDAR